MGPQCDVPKAPPRPLYDDHHLPGEQHSLGRNNMNGRERRTAAKGGKGRHNIFIDSHRQGDWTQTNSGVLRSK